MSACLFETLKTYEGFVSTNADEYQILKTDLCKSANLTFNGKKARKYWKTFDDANVVVFQLDGSYFVIDTDDEESDNFVYDIMAKYGIVDNMTPSLSNYLLGKKNKNHYWFRLPSEMKWTCQTHYTKYGQNKEHSKLDLLGSKNRIMFENKECLDNLKNIPMLSLDILNDLKEYTPMAIHDAPLTIQQKIPKEKINVIMDTTLIDDDKECPEDIKEFIDKYLDAELSTNQDTFFYNSCYLLRKYGDTRNGLGWKAVHYFAKMAGEKVYNKEKVNTWLSGTKIENMKPNYANKIRGKCFINIDDLDNNDDGNESDWSQATTADNVIVSKKEKQKIATSEEDVADIAYDKLKNDYMYVKRQFYGKHGNIWSNDTMQFESLMRNAIVALKIKKRTEKPVKGGVEYIDVIWCNTHSHLMSVFKRVRDKIIANPRDDAYSLFHSTTLGKLCFENGVYDFRRKQFNKWDDEYLKHNPVYSCVKITRNFPVMNNEVQAKDEERMKKIFYDSMGEENAELFLKYLARVTAGEIQDKAFSSLIFERDSSKGVINDWFETAFQNYTGQADSNSFLTKEMSSGDSEKENGWLLPFQYKRFMFVSEFQPNSNSKIHISAKLVKSINSGGDTLKGRYMRENGVEFKIQVSSIFMGNDMPPPDNNDMFEKCLQITSSVQFKTQKQIEELLDQVKDIPELYQSRKEKLKVADDTLRNSVKTNDWADSLVRLMIKYYSDEPVVMKQSKHADEEQESLDIKLMSCFVISGNENDRVTNDVLREFARSSNVGLKKLKETILCINKNVKEYRDAKSRGLSGIKLIPPSE